MMADIPSANSHHSAQSMANLAAWPIKMLYLQARFTLDERGMKRDIREPAYIGPSRLSYNPDLM